MTDWGCPNWRAICEYGEYENWSREQWRWEFKRRSQDIRMGFEMFAINEFKKDNPTKSVPKNLIWRPDYREVHFFCSPSKAASFGYSILRNPLYSKHEPLYLPPRKPHEDFQARTILPWHFWAVENSDLELFDVIGAGSLAISFNPDKTLAPQLDGLEKFLMSKRHHSIGDDLKREHRDKWIRYIRILDAREVGATWAACASEILPRTVSATAHNARDTHRQAKLLQSKL